MSYNAVDDESRKDDIENPRHGLLVNNNATQDDQLTVISGNTGLPKKLTKEAIIQKIVYVLVALIVIAVIATVIVVLILTYTVSPNQLKTYKFDDMFNSALYPSDFYIQWSASSNKDDVFTYWKIDSKNSTGSIVKVDAKTKVETDFITATQIAAQNIDLGAEYSISNTNNFVSFKFDEEKVFRHSTKSNFKIFDATKQTLTPLDASKKQKILQWCPSRPVLSYVSETNDIFIKNYDSSFLPDVDTIQVTTDGNNDTLFNGVTDWLYEEEIFEDISAMSWSNDCNFVLYLKLDDSHVPSYEYSDYSSNNPYPIKQSIRIPAVGASNPIASVHVYNVLLQKSFKLDLESTAIGSGEFYVYDFGFNADSSIYVVQVNRQQNTRLILSADLSQVSNSTTTIPVSTLQTQTTTTWFEFRRNVFFYSPSKFVDTVVNPNTGYHNLAAYVVGKTGAEKFLVEGTFDVVQVFKVFNTQTNEIFFVSTEKGSTDRHIFAVNVDTGVRRNVTMIDVKNGDYYDALFSASGNYFMQYYRGPLIPSSTLVSVLSPNDRKVYKDNANIAANWSQYNAPRIALTTLSNSVGDDLNALFTYPPGFTSNINYPVMVYQYSGPGSQMVSKSWTAQHNSFVLYMASQGVLVVTVDVRGTGYKGHSFMSQTYKQLGNVEVEDLIQVGKQLRNTGYVDQNRMAIFGWSYGGYSSFKTSSSPLNADPVYQLGISVAPVTDWRYYDTGYTERYMSLLSDNFAGYKNSSIFNNIIDEKGNCRNNVPLQSKVDLLLIHGTGDDNVHPLNSFTIMTAMQNCGIQFKFMAYPNKDHGIRDYVGMDYTRRHLWTLISKTITNKFF